MSHDKLETVRKLLAKAERALTEAEAETYNAKARELMARHGIDAALLAAAGEQTDNMDVRQVTIEGAYSMEKSRLIGWIAAAMGCKWTYNHRGRKVNYVTLFGFQSDLERAELVYTSLLLQATSLLVHQRPFRWDESVAAYRRSWFTGFANEVANRVRLAEEAAKEQVIAEEVVTPREGVSTKLVFVDRKDRLDRFYEENTGKLKKARPVRFSGSGFDEGAIAGRKADLGDKRIAPNRKALV